MNSKVLPCFVLAAFLGFPLPAPANESRWTSYSGAYDGSAGVSIDATLFACGSDEDNLIRIYPYSGGRPVEVLDLSIFLRVDPHSPETDLEGAARIGDRIYWITSHGRNKKGKDSPSRRRFFATDVRPSSQTPRIAPIGRPYFDLLEDLVSDNRLRGFGLDRASTHAPKQPGGLNIEALTATSAKHLLIGFRNPVRGGRSLIVPLLNPDEVIEGRRAKFGEPVQLDLEGLGIRSLASWDEGFVILAGPSGTAGRFKIFRWAGDDSAPVAIACNMPSDFTPETVLMPAATSREGFLLLSDDSVVQKARSKVATTAKHQIEFRGLWIQP